MKNKFKYLFLFMAILTLTGCADAVSFQQAAEMQQVGFLHGLWHGIMFPISWICSLFSNDIAVYAIYNNGGWYDFGFFLGIGGFSVGIFHSS